MKKIQGLELIDRSRPRTTERCLRKNSCSFVIPEADLSEIDRQKTQSTLSRSNQYAERDVPEEGFDTFSYACVVKGCSVALEIIKQHDSARITSYAMDKIETCRRI